MSVALLPGSFDPMTLGHLDIVKRAVSLYGEAVVAVMNNENKTYTHTLEQRLKMAELTTAGLPCVRVIADTGMVIDLFDRVGADVIVKGVRNETDRAYEEEMAAWNLSHNPRAKTVLLPAADDFEKVSSTAARECIRCGVAPHGILAEAVIEYLRENGELPQKENCQ